MVQTQLASMYIGNPNAFDAEDRLQGVSSKVDATIHILDGQSNQGVILDYITAKNIISDAHKKSLEDTLETYNFITFADKRFSEYLEKRNRFIIPDEDGTSREFVMYEGAKYKDSEGYKAQVLAHASYLELKKATVLYPESYKGTASQHAGRTLNDTGWQVGIVEVFGNKTLSRSKHTNPYEFLKHIAKEYGAELKFRVEHDGNKVVGRYVDLLERVGDWRGREVVFGKDLDGIRRVEKQNIVTALLGLGPEDEDGNRIEVLVEDEDALKRWGRVDEFGKLHHLIEAYEIQSEREDMTVTEARRYTRTALDKRINESVTYECSIIDLENVPGMANKEIRHGDTIRIKDEHFNPPLYLEARVFEFDRSIKSNAKKDIKLGDFTEFTEEEVNVVWIMLQREIRKKIDIDTLKEYAEPKKVESDTPPEIKEGENPIWVDTSKTPKVPHVVVGGEWVKMSPTTPEEVNAYNKQQVDKKDESVYQDGTIYADQKAAEEARLKAEQALKDAKAFAENAENITKGVIDVGAVPLRTSATGARLEWDGVNGLIQYDSAGNAVSWLDLDANAHFANAFLSGRVEANEGFFGENIRLRNKRMEIVRPDGAISMSDGMVDTSYIVSGADPKYQTATSNSNTISTDPIFAPGGGLLNPPYKAKHWNSTQKGYGDGRSFPNGDGYRDRRDSLGALAYDSYRFIHSSRYLVFKYNNNARSGKHSLHVVNGTSASTSQRIYYELVEASQSGVITCIVDLGKPLFNDRHVTFKIGWAKGWGPASDELVFQMQGVYLTDFI